MSQVRAKENKTSSFFCKVYLNFLRSSKHVHCDTAFALIVSSLNVCIHDFINIRIRKVKTNPETVEI